MPYQGNFGKGPFQWVGLGGGSLGVGLGLDHRDKLVQKLHLQRHLHIIQRIQTARVVLSVGQTVKGEGVVALRRAGRVGLPVVGITKTIAGPHGFVVGGAVEEDLEDAFIFGFVGWSAIDGLEGEGAVDGMVSVCHYSAIPGLVDDVEDFGLVGRVGRGGEGNMRGGRREGEG